MPFIKGQSGNVLGRYPSLKAVQTTAKKHSIEALQVLIDVMQDDTVSADSRVSAANSVLDRATGKQEITQ